MAIDNTGTGFFSKNNDLRNRILFTILILAETHFGATWPFFLDKVNYPYIKEKKKELI